MPTHDVPLLDPDGNLVAWLDRQIFSASHLYEKTRDPEGLLSTLPALATALFGMLTGLWLQTSRSIGEKAKGIAVAGISSVLLGGLWNYAFPINKKLWTSSYVLFAAGWSLLLLALAIWIVDVRGAGKSEAARRKTFMPLLVFGTNAIAAYVFSELLPGVMFLIHPQPGVHLQRWIYYRILGVIASPPMASLIYSLGIVGFCWIVNLYALSPAHLPQDMRLDESRRSLDHLETGLKNLEEASAYLRELVGKPSENGDSSKGEDTDVEVPAELVRRGICDAAEDGIAMHLCKDRHEAHTEERE